MKAVITTLCALFCLATALKATASGYDRYALPQWDRPSSESILDCYEATWPGLSMESTVRYLRDSKGINLRCCKKQDVQSFLQCLGLSRGSKPFSYAPTAMQQLAHWIEEAFEEDGDNTSRHLTWSSCSAHFCRR